MSDLVEVKIENVSGRNVVSSRVVAEQLGKNHSDVTRKIREVLSIGESSDTLEAIENYVVNEQNNQKFLTHLDFAKLVGAICDRLDSIGACRKTGTTGKPIHKYHFYRRICGACGTGTCAIFR